LNWPYTVSVAFGEPVRFHGLPKNGRGYKEATAEIERRINVLFDWLADVHARGRPPGSSPGWRGRSPASSLSTTRTSSAMCW